MRTDKALTEHFEGTEYEHIHLNEKLNSVLKNEKDSGSKLDSGDGKYQGVSIQNL